MRMFLVAMTDIFLILYLTAITNVPTTAVLTVEDFFKLKSMHETLATEKEKAEEDLQAKLRLAKKEQDSIKEELDKEKQRTKDLEKSSLVDDAKLAKINEDIKAKDKMLKEREDLLKDLQQKVKSKEDLWRQMESDLKKKLQAEKESAETNQQLAQKFQREAEKGQQLANQMQEEADLAYHAAETANAVKEQAIRLKEEALKEKAEAERKAGEALEARQRAEAERQQAQAEKEQARAEAEKLAATIADIKQKGGTAYAKNVRPQLQLLNISYERPAASGTIPYSRDLTLLPVKINGQIYVILPTQHIGFRPRSDKAPDKLAITYKGEKITEGFLNAEDNLLAIALQGENIQAHEPYSSQTAIAQLMPALLSLRNNGNRSLADAIRGISDDYFIANRDYIEPDEAGRLNYAVTGFRGTGAYGERIVRGDQLVDLNGRLIGVANEADHIIRIDSLEGWERIEF